MFNTLVFRQLTSAIVLGSTLIAGCSSSSDSSSTTASGSASQFVGTWQTACLPVPGEPGNYDITTISLADNGVSGNFNSVFDTYMDESCGQLPVAEASGTISGTYTLGNTVTTEDGVVATEADLTIVEIIPSGGVATTPSANEALGLDLLHLDGNTLYLGIDVDDINGQPVRPTRIDFDIPFLRQ